METKNKLLIVLLVLFIVSCKKNKTSEIKFVKPLTNKKQENIKNIEGYDLPDTVVVNKIYIRKFKYTSELDTIKPSKDVKRFVFFFITKEEGDFKDVEAIEKVKYEVFAIDKMDTIKYGFKFEKTGYNRFQGIIQDMVLIGNVENDQKGRIITHETKIDKDIFVLDN